MSDGEIGVGEGEGETLGVGIGASGFSVASGFGAVKKGLKLIAPK